MSNTAQDSRVAVVMNGEEQYALWPYDREPPAGWDVVYGPCSKVECLNFVEQVWMDITPLSVRRELAAG